MSCSRISLSDLSASGLHAGTPADGLHGREPPATATLRRKHLPRKKHFPRPWQHEVPPLSTRVFRLDGSGGKTDLTSGLVGYSLS